MSFRILERKPQVESIDLQGLSLEERKMFLLWINTELVEKVFEFHQKLLEKYQDHKLNTPLIIAPHFDIKITERESANTYAKIEGRISDLTDEVLSEFVEKIKQLRDTFRKK